LSVCDTRAIASQDHIITLNPYLCQGCGDCATVCPTGAFQYEYPALANALTRIQAMLQAYADAGGRAPSLLLHDGTKGREWVVAHQSQLPISVLPYEIEALGSTGLELWFMMLALGANQVILLDAGNLESKSQPVVQAQITVAQTLLAAMRYPISAIRWVRPEDISSAALPIRALMTSPPISLDRMGSDKRAVLREAINHLQQGKPVQEPVALPEHSFFGAVRVAMERCTLCMNCVESCPESALVSSDTQKVLSFIEANCIQCQGCTTACPEQAITLEPRYDFGPDVYRPRELMVKQPHRPG
jgi:ferredoxin